MAVPSFFPPPSFFVSGKDLLSANLPPPLYLLLNPLFFALLRLYPAYTLFFEHYLPFPTLIPFSAFIARLRSMAVCQSSANSLSFVASGLR